MGREYKTKNIQTKPKLSGVKNMTKEVIKKHKDIVEDDLMESLIPVIDEYIEGKKRTTNWTPDELLKSVRKYFIYCGKKNLKPSKSSIRIWLGMSRSQYHAWQSEPEKYGEISDIVRMANDLMETQYINRGEAYPTMNIFLLKSSHDHIDKQTVEVNTHNEISKDEISDVVNKLGLDK